MMKTVYVGGDVYLDPGYLPIATSTAFSDPEPYQFSADAWSTTAIKVSPGDTIDFEGTGNLKVYQRIRLYSPDGSYSAYEDGTSATVSDGIGYARYCYLYNGQTLTGATVAHADGSITMYTKIIDRR